MKQLYADQRPDWREHLLYWEAEIGKLDQGYGPVKSKDKLEVGIVNVEAPILRAGTPFAELLSAKIPYAKTVSFLCGSVEPPNPGNDVVRQPTDAFGRFHACALPLFLAEEVHLRTLRMGIASFRG